MVDRAKHSLRTSSKPTPLGRAKTPRRGWPLAERIQAAFLAGKGHSGAEIAEAIGRADAGAVRAMLHTVGIRLPHRAPDGEVLEMRWPKRVAQAVRDAAHRRDLDPESMLIEAISRVVAEPTLLDNLLDLEVSDAKA